MTSPPKKKPSKKAAKKATKTPTIQEMVGALVDPINGIAWARVNEPRASLLRLLGAFGEGDNDEAARVIARASRELLEIKGDLAGTFGLFGLLILEAYGNGDIARLYRDEGPLDVMRRRSRHMADPAIGAQAARRFKDELVAFLTEDGSEIGKALIRLDDDVQAMRLAWWGAFWLVHVGKVAPETPLIPWDAPMNDHAVLESIREAASRIREAARRVRVNEKTIAIALLSGLGLDETKARNLMRHA